MSDQGKVLQRPNVSNTSVAGQRFSLGLVLQAAEDRHGQVGSGLAERRDADALQEEGAAQQICKELAGLEGGVPS